jgi:hypothetical protein
MIHFDTKHPKKNLKQNEGKIGKRNNAENIELKQNLAVFSYVKRKFRSENY